MTLLTISTWIPVTILSFHFKAIFPFYFQMKSETFQDIFVQQVVVQTKCAKRKIRSLILQWKIKSYCGVKSDILHHWLLTIKASNSNFIHCLWKQECFFLENMSITTAKLIGTLSLWPPSKTQTTDLECFSFLEILRVFPEP